MAKVEVSVQEPPVQPVEDLTAPGDRGGSFVDLTRRIMLASIGAVALAQEELEAFVNRLVERGELAEQDGKRLMRDVMERRRRQAEKAEDGLEKRIESILARMSVPTKADIEVLSAKITELGKKVDELKAK